MNGYICSTAVCDIVCLSYETLREALASSQEAAYHLCNAVHSMLELYADFCPSHRQQQISSLPLFAGMLHVLEWQFLNYSVHHAVMLYGLQGFETFGWASGRASGS